jgi:hypothetical protein
MRVRPPVPTLPVRARSSGAAVQAHLALLARDRDHGAVERVVLADEVGDEGVGG